MVKHIAAIFNRNLAASLFSVIAGMPGVAHAGKECSAFTVTITQGTDVRTVRPGTEVTLSNVAPGAVLRASGRVRRFEVDLDTLAVGP
jgi:hypothetical protein